MKGGIFPHCKLPLIEKGMKKVGLVDGETHSFPMFAVHFRI